MRRDVFVNTPLDAISAERWDNPDDPRFSMVAIRLQDDRLVVFDPGTLAYNDWTPPMGWTLGDSERLSD